MHEGPYGASASGNNILHCSFGHFGRPLGARPTALDQRIAANIFALPELLKCSSESA